MGNEIKNNECYFYIKKIINHYINHINRLIFVIK